MSEFSYTTMDCFVGVLLCLASLIGTVMNSLAFYYFKCTRKRNQNGRFFKRLYSIISLNDILICVGVFPAVEAAFTPGRRGSLFSNEIFCSVWFVAWFTIYYTSMILIAFLSISRLVLIMSPKYLLNPWLSYGVVLTAAVLIFIFWTSLTACHLIYTTFYTEHLFCGFATFASDNGTALYESGSRAGALLIIVNGVSILCFLSVCSSFILSLIFLHKFSRAARSQGMSSKHQIAAARTVILVTFLYILFNVPLMMITLYMIADRFTDPIPDTATVAYMIDRVYTRLFNDANFLNHYGFAFAFVMSACLNSMMNPIVYSRRIRGFKSFLVKVWKYGSTSLDNPSSTNMNMPAQGKGPASIPQNTAVRSENRLSAIQEGSM